MRHVTRMKDGALRPARDEGEHVVRVQRLFSTAPEKTALSKNVAGSHKSLACARARQLPAGSEGRARTTEAKCGFYCEEQGFPGNEAVLDLPTGSASRSEGDLNHKPQ